MGASVGALDIKLCGHRKEDQRGGPFSRIWQGVRTPYAEREHEGTSVVPALISGLFYSWERKPRYLSGSRMLNRKSPQSHAACGLYSGARGIRTPKSFRTLAFEASALAILPALHRTMPEPVSGQGIVRVWAVAWIWTTRAVWSEGTISIGVPGFEPGTSATRTQRSTGLSHTPDYSGTCIRTGWDSNPRGQCPHDFQSCALSHSATRPN